MYKVLIIDDEEMIRSGIKRNGIKNAVPWGKYDIGEVKTASNGEDGENILIIYYLI